PVEYLVAFRDLVQRRVMGHDGGRHALAVCDQRHEVINIVVHWRLSGGDLDALVHPLSEREVVVGGGVDTEYRHASAASHGGDDIVEYLYRTAFKVHGGLHFSAHATVGLHADGVDADIGAMPAGGLEHCIDRVPVVGVDGFRVAGLARHVEPVWHDIDSDDALCTAVPRAFLRHQPDRPAAEHRDRVALAHVRPFGARPAGWQDIGQEQRLVVGKCFRHDATTVIRIGNANGLRLAAVVTAVEVGVAEQAAALVLQHAAAHAVFFGIRVFATDGYLV